MGPRVDGGALAAERSADGTIRQTDALDLSSVALWLYKQHEIPA